MAEWNNILDNFKKQFDVQGPDKYSDIKDPSARYALAANGQAQAAQGANVAIGGIRENTQRAQAAAAEAEAKAQEANRTYNKAGGYSFTDGNGKPISAWEFSMRKQIPISEALKGSYDQGDIEFLQSAKAMEQDLMNGSYDVNTGLRLLAEDHPSVFGLESNNAGSGNFKAFRRNLGEQKIGSTLNALQGSEYYDSLSSAVSALRQTNNYNEAKAVANQFFLSPDFDSLDGDKQSEVADTIKAVLSELYSQDSLGTKATGGTYPF